MAGALLHYVYHFWKESKHYYVVVVGGERFQRTRKYFHVLYKKSLLMIHYQVAVALLRCIYQFWKSSIRSPFWYGIIRWLSLSCVALIISGSRTGIIIGGSIQRIQKYSHVIYHTSFNEHCLIRWLALSCVVFIISGSGTGIIMWGRGVQRMREYSHVFYQKSFLIRYYQVAVTLLRWCSYFWT